MNTSLPIQSELENHQLNGAANSQRSRLHADCPDEQTLVKVKDLFSSFAQNLNISRSCAISFSRREINFFPSAMEKKDFPRLKIYENILEGALIAGPVNLWTLTADCLNQEIALLLKDKFEQSIIQNPGSFFGFSVRIEPLVSSQQGTRELEDLSRSAPLFVDTGLSKKTFNGSSQSDTRQPDSSSFIKI